MNIQLEVWHLFSMLVVVIGGYWTLGKLLAAQASKTLTAQFAALSDRLDRIEASARHEAQQWGRVEREILQLKAELPLNYVRREDYVHAVATIMSKLDAMSLRFENILLQRKKSDE